MNEKAERLVTVFNRDILPQFSVDNIFHTLINKLERGNVKISHTFTMVEVKESISSYENIFEPQNYELIMNKNIFSIFHANHYIGTMSVVRENINDALKNIQERCRNTNKYFDVTVSYIHFSGCNFGNFVVNLTVDSAKEYSTALFNLSFLEKRNRNTISKHCPLLYDEFEDLYSKFQLRDGLIYDYPDVIMDFNRVHL